MIKILNSSVGCKAIGNIKSQLNLRWDCHAAIFKKTEEECQGFLLILIHDNSTLLREILSSE